jgi:CubicO group peptidase (beta-lactamase class C family)
MAHVKGYCDPRFEKLKKLLQQKLTNSEELGASIVLNIDGKNVIDLWGGFSDEAEIHSWNSDTITNIWSSTKAIASLAVLVAHDRGFLHVDDPVAKHWPEFAQHGKSEILIRHCMSHTAGLPGWDEPITAVQVCDNTQATSRLEKQSPWWNPGSGSGYHSITMGNLLGEIVRRATGKTMKRFLAEEIAAPLRADIQIGAHEIDYHRISPVIPPPTVPLDFAVLDPKSFTVRVLTNPPLDANVAMWDIWRQADLPAANGHANARSLNRVLSAIPNGGMVDGFRVLSPETIELIFREQADGTDLVIGQPVRFGIGYGLGGGGTARTAPWLPTEKLCFWGGWGGSLALMDCHRKLTFTYVMNKMDGGLQLGGSDRTREYVELVYKILGSWTK